VCSCSTHWQCAPSVVAVHLAARDSESKTNVSATPTPSLRVARPGQATLASHGDTRVEVDVVSPDGGWVVLADMWHPWWAAEVDGNPAPLVRGDVLFRAVPVPPGAHRVSFVFRPLAGVVAEVPEWLSQETEE
jgi:hypothetical protein